MRNKIKILALFYQESIQLIKTNLEVYIPVVIIPPFLTPTIIYYLINRDLMLIV